MIKVAVIWINYGPYHIARAKALARVDGIKPIFIELASMEHLRPWKVRQKDDQIQLVTLFNKPYEKCKTLELCSALRRTLAEINPDILATCGYSPFVMLDAARWARSKKKGSVLMTQSTHVDRLRHWYKEAIKSWIVNRYYDAAFVGGRRQVEYLTKLGMAKEWVWEGYSAVDNFFFLRQADLIRSQQQHWRAGHNLPQNYFLFVGRYSPEKNLLKLLEAYNRYRKTVKDSWQLLLVGDGPQYKVLKSFIEQKDLAESVQLHDFKQINDLPVFYALGKFLILPSVSEPWGLVVNEAMASGLPALVSDRVGCVSDLVQEGETGFAFDPYDVDALAELMKKVTLLSEQQCSLMSSNCRKTISNFTVERWANNLSLCIRTVFEKKNGRNS